LQVDSSGNLLENSREPPDIAIEIVSPRQSIRELVGKCRWYVEHGARIALLVEPRRRVVRDLRPGQPPRILRGSDRIDLDAVIPGLALVVDDLFGLLRIRGARP
jgi:Uma2 family endonuclease